MIALHETTRDENLMCLDLLLHELKTHGLEARVGLEKLGELSAAFKCQQMHDLAVQAICLLEQKHPFLQ